MKTHRKRAKRNILSLIEDTWERNPPPPDVCVALSQVSDIDLELNDVRKFFLNKNWWEIEVDVFESPFPDLFLIEKIPLRYYFPAFLRASILINNSIGTVTERIISWLVPPKKDKDRRLFEEQFSSLAINERNCILFFLEYMIIVYRHRYTKNDIRTVRRIQNAIETYWCLCPSPVLPPKNTASNAQTDEN